MAAAAAAFCVCNYYLFLFNFDIFFSGGGLDLRRFFLWWNSNSGIESRVCVSVSTRAQKKYCCWWSWWLFSGEEIFALLSSSVFFSHKSTLVLNETPPEPTPGKRHRYPGSAVGPFLSFIPLFVKNNFIIFLSLSSFTLLFSV